MGITPILKNVLLFPMNILYDINPKAALKLLYRVKQGYSLNLDNPLTYSEKLQWEKLYYKDPILTKLVDKYTVREYVEQRCPEILVPLLWEGTDPKTIPWETLPEKFVIKVTHGSGFNIICTNKNLLNHREVERKLTTWLKAKFLKCYGEWFYGVVPPRIIIEEYLDCGTGQVPEDYKVMCFSGKPEYIIVDTDRYIKHKRNIYDTDWKFRENVSMGFINDVPVVPPRKELSDLLLHYAEILSEGFPHVRVDLYIVKGKIYFGEMTFTNGAGFDKIRPRDFDVEMGKYFDLSPLLKKTVKSAESQR